MKYIFLQIQQPEMWWYEQTENFWSLN